MLPSDRGLFPRSSRAEPHGDPSASPGEGHRSRGKAQRSQTSRNTQCGEHSGAGRPPAAELVFPTRQLPPPVVLHLSPRFPKHHQQLIPTAGSDLIPVPPRLGASAPLPVYSAVNSSRSTRPLPIFHVFPALTKLLRGQMGGTQAMQRGSLGSALSRQKKADRAIGSQTLIPAPPRRCRGRGRAGGTTAPGHGHVLLSASPAPRGIAMRTWAASGEQRAALQNGFSPSKAWLINTGGLIS